MLRIGLDDEAVTIALHLNVPGIFHDIAAEVDAPDRLPPGARRHLGHGDQHLLTRCDSRGE